MRIKHIVMKVITEIYQLALIGLTVFIILSTTIQNYKVSGSSMDPRLEGGDHLLINKFTYLSVNYSQIDHILPFWTTNSEDLWELNNPVRGEIVVFKYPLDETQYFVKRVIGLPNETITISGNAIYVDGYKLIEPYIGDFNNSHDHQYLMGEEEYFLLGDNRDNSNDSRHWGPVKRTQILGKVLYKYWPIN